MQTCSTTDACRGAQRLGGARVETKRLAFLRNCRDQPSRCQSPLSPSLCTQSHSHSRTQPRLSRPINFSKSKEKTPTAHARSLPAMDKKNAPAAVASVNWASLSADGPLHKIGECLLANEQYADTYSAMRQVCRNWRSGLPEPDVHLHEWIMLDHGLPRAADFTFLHLRTSRYVTIDLTEVHARFKFLHIYRVNLFLFSIVNILVLNVIFINIF